ncbi:hypothetical protein FQN57_004037 [Myotisia sp. PD_48]|nr:hypothetical protein FQN57_004037 [Myotisia sp. PD_48]
MLDSDIVEMTPELSESSTPPINSPHTSPSAKDHSEPNVADNSISSNGRRSSITAVGEVQQDGATMKNAVLTATDRVQEELSSASPLPVTPNESHNAQLSNPGPRGWGGDSIGSLNGNVTNMEELLKLSLKNDKLHLKAVVDGKYELVLAGRGTRHVILPRFWDELFQPGWTIEIFFKDLTHFGPAPPNYTTTSHVEVYENKVAYTVEYRLKGKGSRSSEHPGLICRKHYIESVSLNARTGHFTGTVEKELKDDQSTKVFPFEEVKVIALAPLITRPVTISGPEPLWLENLKVHPDDEIFHTTLLIGSPFVLNLLRSIVEYISLSQPPPPYNDPRSLFTRFRDGEFRYPFQDLYFHKNDLLNYKNDTTGARSKHSAEYNAKLDSHIDILVDYLYRQPAIPLKESEDLQSKNVPTTTFAGFWFLMKPGTDVYVRDDNGDLNAFVIDRVYGGVLEGGYAGTSTVSSYNVIVWHLIFDGKVFKRSPKIVEVPPFDNECEIRSLPIYPTRFEDNADGGKTRQALIQRGRKYFAYCKKPTFLEYTGQGLKPGYKNYTRARVVMEHASQPWKGMGFEDSDLLRAFSIPVPASLPPPPPGPPPPPSSLPRQPNRLTLGLNVRIPRCECHECESSPSPNVYTVSRYGSYDNINPTKVDKLGEHQYLICASHMFGFIIKDRAYVIALDLLDLHKLSEPIITEHAIDKLVLKPEKTKDSIKAVAKTYTDRKAQLGTFSADFIHGKGEGQILLLHGPPGTGKTLTAESVAEFCRRPLLSITAADLGHEPETLEPNLLDFLKKATDWDAIVLLDEADVYLESRSIHDLKRNSIVSSKLSSVTRLSANLITNTVFLRALDYFEGILFLTTNRVGSFDEAFLSRIHISIGYSPLDDEARQKIWDNLFDKLKDEAEAGGLEISVQYDAKELVRRSSALRELKWNGREIWNGFQTAVALAVYDARIAREKDENYTKPPQVTDKHMRQIVDMSSAFKEYIKNTHDGKNASAMAYSFGLRDDGSEARGWED